MATKWLAIASVALLMLVQPLLAGKVLGYFITPSRSHFIIQDALMRGLAANGHEVTVVSLFPPPAHPIANYTSIQLNMSADTQLEMDVIFSTLLDVAQKKENFFMRMPKIIRVVRKMNRESYTHPLVQQLRREQSFDLVVFGWFFNDFQVGLSEHFKCPAVMVVSMGAVKSILDFVGNPTGVAHTPIAGIAMESPMNFQSRILNFLGTIAITAISKGMDYFIYSPEYSFNFPSDKYPSYDAAKLNIALVLVSSHFSQNGPIASFPSLIEVGGMQAKKHADPLPEAIQHWLDNAEHGVVYFSLGSNVRSNLLPAEMRDAILRVFGRLKQRVLWKFEEDSLPGKPANVMVQKWLPQDDVLAHRNVKLFVSHCGKGGISEARYHGVPILGIPIFGDQPNNLVEIVAEGWAVSLLYTDFTEDTFEAALNEALYNSTYSNVAQTASQLYRDRPQHPLDTAVYWSEYVMRHKGAKHMQSQAVEQTWFEYHSVDVIATLVVLAWVLFKITVFVWRRIWRLVCGSRKEQKTKLQ